VRDCSVVLLGGLYAVHVRCCYVLGAGACPYLHTYPLSRDAHSSTHPKPHHVHPTTSSCPLLHAALNRSRRPHRSLPPHLCKALVARHRASSRPALPGQSFLEQVLCTHAHTALAHAAHNTNSTRLNLTYGGMFSSFGRQGVRGSVKGLCQARPWQSSLAQNSVLDYKLLRCYCLYGMVSNCHLTDRYDAPSPPPPRDYYPHYHHHQRPPHHLSPRARG
jgi:hypothetical protein